jgi:catechol 2,3-dioxygenase-like lactoylglutathione lyase family enzyme
MSWLKGVPAVTYAVREETIRRWAWFWIEGLGGELAAKEDDVSGLTRWRINLGAFDTVLIASIDKQRDSKVKEFTNTFGDHSVFSIDYAIDNLAQFQEYLNKHPNVRVPGTPLGANHGFNFVPGPRTGSSKKSVDSSILKRVDHITYAVTRETIEECARFWTDGMGGTLVLKNDDVRPDDSSDSMMLWGIVLNKGIPEEEFGIALVAGIDRRQVSQVTRFVAKKGPNIVQHVAYDVGDMVAFRRRFEGEFGANLLSETLIVPDGFGGYVKQVFGRGYESGNAAEVGFPEFLERLEGSGKGFTNAAGEGLYEKVKRISEEGDDTPIVDFSAMPADWEPPEPKEGPFPHPSPLPKGEGAKSLT